MNKGYFVVEIT